MTSLGQGIKTLLNAGQGRSLEDPLSYTHQVLYGGSPIPFLITESLKIIWYFHTSRQIQNKISHSRISQNLNSHLGHTFFILWFTDPPTLFFDEMEKK